MDQAKKMIPSDYVPDLIHSHDQHVSDTTLKYREPVNLFFYNHPGEKLIAQFHEYQAAFKHKMVWSIKEFPSGLCFCVLQTAKKAEIFKMIKLG